MTDRLTHLLAEAKAFYDRSADLQAFATWPENLPTSDRGARTLTSTPLIAGHPSNDPFARAISAASGDCYWRQTYKPEEVGQHFLDTYGWFELFGPTGHFHCEDLRAYVAYWGPSLQYSWHRHEAEEIYAVISGSAQFEAEGLIPATLEAGYTRFHSSNQNHAMTTQDDAILCFVLWRGSGLTAAAQMSA